MSDTEPNAHDQMPTNAVFLELVIKPTIGEPNQVAVMYFRYSDIYGHGNATESDRVRYLQTEIQARYAQLNANAGEAAGELRGALRQWAPHLNSPARCTVQIPGQLDLPGGTSAGQNEIAALQGQLMDADYQVWVTNERIKLAQRDQATKEAEWANQERIRQKQAAADVERLQRDLEALRATWRATHIESREKDARLESLNQERARLEQMLSDAQQHGGQAASGDVNELLGKLAEAYQTIDELQRPFNDGDAGHASASAWSHSAQPTPADAPPPQGDAACGSLYRTKPDEDEPPARVYPAVNGLDN